MKRVLSLASTLSEEELRQRLQPHVEIVEDFKIISKLSDGGVVVRTLKAPQSERTFYGILDDSVQLAELRYDKNLTPYQPIVRIGFEKDSPTRVVLTATLPKKMYELGWIYNIAGGLLVLSSLPLYLSKISIGITATFFGAMLLIYPKLRAKISFDEATDSVFTKIKALPLGWVQLDEQGPSQ